MPRRHSNKIVNLPVKFRIITVYLLGKRFTTPFFQKKSILSHEQKFAVLW